VAERALAAISTSSNTVSSREYPQATNALEQPVWDLQTHRFYMSVPATVANPDGEVDEIEPTTETVTRVFPITTPALQAIERGWR
jgi:hypothetical protein